MASTASPPEPTIQPVVLDKNMTRVNLGILASVVIMFVYGTAYLKDIEHAVGNANTTLQEVKVQLEKQNGTMLQHHRDLILLTNRLDQLEKQHAADAKRIKDLERGK